MAKVYTGLCKRRSFFIYLLTLFYLRWLETKILELRYNQLVNVTIPADVNPTIEQNTAAARSTFPLWVSCNHSLLFITPKCRCYVLPISEKTNQNNKINNDSEMKLPAENSINKLKPCIITSKIAK